MRITPNGSPNRPENISPARARRFSAARTSKRSTIFAPETKWSGCGAKSKRYSRMWIFSLRPPCSRRRRPLAGGAGAGARNTSPFDVFGIPTISIPCGFSASGLPIGLQISGRPGRRRRCSVLLTLLSKRQIGTRGGDALGAGRTETTPVTALWRAGFSLRDALAPP